MDLLRSTSCTITAVTGQAQLYMLLWRKILEGLIKPIHSLRVSSCAGADSPDGTLYNDVKETFTTKYLEYDDVRWFVLRDAP